MALDLAGDLSVFFNSDEFAVSCTLASAAVIKVILSTPDQELFSQMLVTADAKAIAKTSDVTALNTDDTVTISAQAYTIKKIIAVDDGLLSEIYLSRS